MKYFKFIFFLFIILTSQITLAQVATTYSVMTKYIQSGIAGGCDMSETGNEEYTGFLASNDEVNTTWVSSGCQTIDVNGIGTYAQNIPLQTRTNNSYNIKFSMDAWEDDYGDRCTWDTGTIFVPGDDCRSQMEVSYNFRDTPPSNGTYTDTPVFNSGYGHQFQMKTTWKYFLNEGASYTPSCNTITTVGWFGASPLFPDQGTVFSYLLDLTQGISYNFTTCGLSSEDTIIRVYGADGYTVIASNDDSCSLQSNLDFTPSSSGKYVVEVSRYVSSSNSHGPLLEDGSVKITISGGSPPQPQVSFDSQFCHGASTTLTATNVGNYQVNWYTGNYTPYGNNNNLLFTGNPFITPPLSSQNNYVVEFVNTNNCLDFSTLEIWVSPLDEPIINNVSSVCSGNSVVLSSSTPAGTIYWYDDAYNLLGSGNTFSTPLLTQNTVFYARVENQGCFSNYANTTVNVIPIPDTPTSGNNGPLCVGSTLSLNTSEVTGASYSWSGPNGFTSAQQNPTVSTSATASMSGSYSVIVTVNGCSSSASSTSVTVNPLPVAAGTITGNSTVCQGETSVTYTVPAITNATSYIWTSPTGATGTSTTNSIDVDFGTTAISGDITVKGTNSCGDGSASTLAITVDPLPVAAGTITGNSTVCQGETSVTYTVPAITNATSYIWTLPTGATGTSTTNSIDVDFGTTAISGDITVKGTNSCGDGDDYNLFITVVPAPTAYAGADTIICQGESITLTATGGNSYVWSNGISQGLPFVPSGTQTYTVTVSNGFCTSVDSILVTISTPPAAPVIYQVGNDLHSTATSGNQWYNDNGLIPGATSQIYSPTLSSNYFVILTDSLGCIADTSNTLYVGVTGITESINKHHIQIYPNPVSNELIIEIVGKTEKVNFEILNAIGQVILKGDLIEKTTVQTSNFVPGVYLIKIENGKTFEFKKILKL